jgi:hypothetical protein
MALTRTDTDPSTDPMISPKGDSSEFELSTSVYSPKRSNEQSLSSANLKEDEERAPILASAIRRFRERNESKKSDALLSTESIDVGNVLHRYDNIVKHGERPMHPQKESMAQAEVSQDKHQLEADSPDIQYSKSDSVPSNAGSITVCNESITVDENGIEVVDVDCSSARITSNLDERQEGDTNNQSPSGSRVSLIDLTGLSSTE